MQNPGTDPSHSRKIRCMFGDISRRYDLMNRLMTFGQDHVWRREVVVQARLRAGCRLLDVGAGTGSITLAALRRHPGLRITAVDFARPMMAVGQGRTGSGAIRWCQADALNLPFGDSVFDAVTSGYLIRNVTDPLAAFREQARVLKPGGRVVCLDTSPPPSGHLRPLIRFHLRVIIPLLGQLITGNRAAYTYLPQSTQAFFEPERLASIMHKAGLENIRHRSFMFGTIAVHVGCLPK